LVLFADLFGISFGEGRVELGGLLGCDLGEGKDGMEEWFLAVCFCLDGGESLDGEGRSILDVEMKGVVVRRATVSRSRGGHSFSAFKSSSCFSFYGVLIVFPILLSEIYNDR
jgi:hypothetical protein